jgi:glutathione S-transferase
MGLSQPQLELFVHPATIYPRRVLIYLREKFPSPLPESLLRITHITTDVKTGRMTAPGKPDTASVPILRLPDGTYIRQSLSIINFFEDICRDPCPFEEAPVEWKRQISEDAKQHASGPRAGKPESLRGNTPEERARVNDLLSAVDEASTLFCFAAHKGSQLFVPLEETDKNAARLIMERCRAILKVIDGYYDTDGVFEINPRPQSPSHNQKTANHGTDVKGYERGATVPDCVLFALLEFADKIYGIDFFESGNLPHLRAFHERFGRRSSAEMKMEDWKLVEGWAPIARQWL